jgi:hypothetical protein
MDHGYAIPHCKIKGAGPGPKTPERFGAKSSLPTHYHEHGEKPRVAIRSRILAHARHARKVSQDGASLWREIRQNLAPACNLPPFLPEDIDVSHWSSNFHGGIPWIVVL